MNRADARRRVAATPCDLMSTAVASRTALYHAGPSDRERLHALQHDIEHSLSQVISRTERLTVSGAHNGMTKSRTRTVPVHESDLRSYLLVHDIAGQLGHPQVAKLWKSAPYLLNFLDGYELHRRLETEGTNAATSRPLADILRAGENELLSGEAVESFAELDAGTPRLRELAADVIDSGAWRLLWVPPAMPYYRLAGAYGEPQLEHFTKRLVFSAWSGERPVGCRHHRAHAHRPSRQGGVAVGFRQGARRCSQEGRGGGRQSSTAST